MSKDIRSVRDQVKAPKRLVNAVIKGERVAPKHKTDTAATHIRRFSKIFAVYACVAVLLIGSAVALPALLDNPAASQPQPDATVSDQTPDNALLPEDFIRPDLVWADETNKMSEQIVFSWYKTLELKSGATDAARWNVMPEGYVYAVKAEAMNFPELQTGIGSIDAPPELSDSLITFLTETEGWESFEGPDGELCFAVTKAQLDALDTDALFAVFQEVFESVSANGGAVEYVGGILNLTIAWQSPTGAPPIETVWPDYWMMEEHRMPEK